MTDTMVADAPADQATPATAPRVRKERNTRHLSDFTDLTKRVKAEGLMARSHGWYISRMVAYPLLLGGLAWASVMIGDSWWQLGMAFLVAVLMTQIAFLGHDAAHRQIFTSPKLNEWTSLVVINLFVGMGLGWWQIKHSKHHATPNQAGRDPDVRRGTVAYTPEDARSRSTAFQRWLSRYQGVWFFPIMTLAGLQLHLAGFQRLLSREPVDRRWTEIAFIVIRQATLVTFAFLVMSWPIALAFIAVEVMVFGFYLGMSFAPNHIGMPMVPKEVRIDFLRRQVLMSRNISGGRHVDTLLGGLNYQIEHHLFPSMSRPNLRKVAPMVREHCERLDIKYHETSLARSYVEVGRYINRVGRGNIDVWACPLAGSLRAGLV
ncbi:fatty acid desaturase family protein [Occultella kanbiaonis]|uniref:fatty acid desaturase family protein n=1 Tax=Occultella kanbiaonis TaxID=2675754 RepID=UPI001E37AD3B|nr:acyl-CoA desaturase [Occultella kanbiaonis]